MSLTISFSSKEAPTCSNAEPIQPQRLLLNDEESEGFLGRHGGHARCGGVGMTPGSLCLRRLFFRRAKGKRAIICLAETFGVYPKSVVEPRAVVFPGNGCRQLDQLRLGELFCETQEELLDRKSTRLNSSHRCISYA